MIPSVLCVFVTECMFLGNSHVYSFAFNQITWDTSSPSNLLSLGVNTKKTSRDYSSHLENAIASVDENPTTTEKPKSGISAEQEDELDEILMDALDRTIFIMENNVLARCNEDSLIDLFRTCVESVELGKSTIPGAGQGLFAKSDIPKGTIVAFYPIHSIGCKFPSGICQSVQAAEDSNHQINNENSAYALFSLVDRPLCGVDISSSYNNAKMFVDMNPKNTIYEGWFCGMINDGAVVRYANDEEYYSNSRKLQNVEIVPFSCAPFHVGVTTRHVQAGEELFVSYGYKYWINNKMMFPDDKDYDGNTEVAESILRQEEEIATCLSNTIQDVQTQHREASEALQDVFNALGGETELPVEGGDVEENENKLTKKGSFVASLGRWVKSTITWPARLIKR